MKKRKMLFLYVVISMIWGLSMVSPALSVDLDIAGETVNFMGYLNQSVYYGLRDKYDSQQGFNSIVTQANAEATYMPNSNFRVFLSGALDADWAYSILDGDDDWEKKQFDESEDRLQFLDDWQDILDEANVTWANDKFFFRVGKQIVQWGQMDGYLITNLINPIDQRRGISDVEFESTIIPIWLLRGEYNANFDNAWLTGMGVQLVVDPAFKFRGNELMLAGNQAQGVWAPNINAGPLHLGAIDFDIEEPDDFDEDYFTYGLRLRGFIKDSIVDFLFYYGRDRDFVSTTYGTSVEVSPYDGKGILHLKNRGYYPRFKFIGGTFTKELTGLSASFLGGVAPVLRLEGLYAFDSTYANTLGTKLYETDEIRAAIGIDWKVKVPFLNAKKFISISPQYYYQKIVNYPTDGSLLMQRNTMAGNFYEDNHKGIVVMRTDYYNGKIQPTVVVNYDFSNYSGMAIIKCAYVPSYKWSYTLGTTMFFADRIGRGFEPLDNKDHIFFTVGYTF